jgi:hypothetical protein
MRQEEEKLNQPKEKAPISLPPSKPAIQQE